MPPIATPTIPPCGERDRAELLLPPTGGVCVGLGEDDEDDGEGDKAEETEEDREDGAAEDDVEVMELGSPV